MPIVVEILSGSRRGQRVVLDKPAVTLGRRPDNDVVFDALAEPLVSAVHAEVRELGPGSYLLVDRESSNGTWVAGARVTQLAFDGRLELRLAERGPRIALLPLSVVPVQAADAMAGPGAPPRPAAGLGIDPLVVAPTLDGPAGPARPGRDGPGARAPEGGGYRGPARIGPATPERAAREDGAAPVRTAAPPAQPGGPARADEVPGWQRTVPLGALEGAGARGPARPTTTARIRAVAGDVVRRSSRRFWAVVVVLGTLLAAAALLLALLATGTLSFGGGSRNRPGAAGTDGGPVTTTAATKPSAKEIVARNQDAIFLLGAELLGKSEGFCTGFALTPRILATNAHCVKEMQKIWQALGDGQGVFAYQNQHPGVKHRVLFALMDPGYKEDDSTAIYPDVGLAMIEGRAERQVTLASAARAAQLRTGDHIYLLGFPGALNSAESPVATLTVGIVERLTDLGQRLADPERSVLIQHSAFTTKGTSGSPLFDEDGEVVGINTGYYRGESEQKRLDPVTGHVRDEMVTQDLQDYAIGMRVDLVHNLLRLLYERIPGAREDAADDAGS